MQVFAAAASHKSCASGFAWASAARPANAVPVRCHRIDFSIPNTSSLFSRNLSQVIGHVVIQEVLIPAANRNQLRRETLGMGVDNVP
jgi:hypothetical protein